MTSDNQNAESYAAENDDNDDPQDNNGLSDDGSDENLANLAATGNADNDNFKAEHGSTRKKGKKRKAKYGNDRGLNKKKRKNETSEDEYCNLSPPTKFKLKQWVRVQCSNEYENDIGQIVSIRQKQVELKLLPRIDFTQLSDTTQTNQSSTKKKRKVSAKRFDPKAIRNSGGVITFKNGFHIFKGKRYSQEGLLYKHFPKSEIITEDVNPTAAHKKRFKFKEFKCMRCGRILASKESLDRHALIHTLEENRPRFNCAHCSICFFSRDSIKRHLLTIHFNQTEFKCKYCDTIMNRKHNLNIHERAHYNRGDPPKVNTDNDNAEQAIVAGFLLVDDNHDKSDTGPVRDRVKYLGNQRKNLDTSISEKAKLTKQHAEQQTAYENMKNQILVWLATIENRINTLSPMGADLTIITHQVAELKPLAKEHRDYRTIIDKVNDLGTQYDLVIHQESPSSKQSSYSSNNRPTANSLPRLSNDGRSPSLDLSPIRQQLSEINNRYNLVRVQLNDRQNELDGLKDEVKKYQQSLRSLEAFLDKIQRQVPKDVIGNKNEAEKCIKQAGKVLEEMCEQQSLLGLPKSQIKDLISRKADTEGVDKLKSEFNEVVERWKNSNDLCKNLINFSKQLTDFLDTHDKLNSWLKAKECFLTVLGPISSDPRMVQCQAQQVEVLRQEFCCQQPQLDHLHEVIKHAGVDQFKEIKLKNIVMKWDNLIGQLDKRASSLKAASNTSNEFDADFSEAQRKLEVYIARQEGALDNLPPAGRETTVVIGQLENVSEILDGIKKAEDECAGFLSPMVETSGKMSKLDQDIQTIKNRAKIEKEKLAKVFEDLQSFDFAYKNAFDKLTGLTAEIDRLQPVRAKLSCIYNQESDLCSLRYEKVNPLSDGIDEVNRLGNNLVLTAHKCTSTADLTKDLENLNKKMADIHKTLNLRQQDLDKNLQDISSSTVTFYCQLRELVEETLKKLKTTLELQEPPAAQEQQIQKQQDELQEIYDKINQTEPDVEQVRLNGNKLLLMCIESDKPDIKKNIEALDQSWNDITSLYDCHKKNLNDALNKAMEFNTLQNLLTFLTKAEDEFSKLEPIGTDIDTVEIQIEQLEKEVDAQNVEFEALLKSQTPAQSNDIYESLNAHRLRWKTLLQGTDERKKKLKQNLKQLHQVKDALEELSIWIGNYKAKAKQESIGVHNGLDYIVIDDDTTAIIIDTNILLHHFDPLKDLLQSIERSKRPINVIIPYQVHKELDRQSKQIRDITPEAIRAVDFIDEQIKATNSHIIIQTATAHKQIEDIMIDVHDDYILNCALQYQRLYDEAIMVTCDNVLQNKTLATFIKTRTLKQIRDELKL